MQNLVDEAASSSASQIEKSEQAWESRLRELQEYKAEHGDTSVPARYPPNKQLGHWVMTQRRQYTLREEGKQSALTSERIRKLEHLGFAWTVRESNDSIWNRRIKELAQYQRKYGDCLVPQRYQANPSLGTWVNTQRRHYKLLREGKRSSMTQERIRALEQLGFQWQSPQELAKKRKSRDWLAMEMRGGRESEAAQQLLGQNLQPSFFGQVQSLPDALPSGTGFLPTHSVPQPSSTQNNFWSQNLVPPAFSMEMFQTPSLAITAAPPPPPGGMMETGGMNIQPSGPSGLSLSGPWTCPFCLLPIFGSYDDVRAHESQCRWRRYSGSPS